jgi:prevent-host-death family protein
MPPTLRPADAGVYFCEQSRTGLVILEMTRGRHSMATFDIKEAKAALSKLIDDALAGQDVVISRDGVEVARLTPMPALTQQHGPRTPGRLKGKVWISPDFEFTDAEIDDFEGPLCG